MPEELTVAEVLEMMERDKTVFHDMWTALIVVHAGLFDMRAALKLAAQEFDAADPGEAEESDDPGEVPDADGLLAVIAYGAMQVGYALKRLGHVEAALSFLVDEHKGRTTPGDVDADA